MTCLFYTVLLVYWHAYFTQYYWSIDIPILHSITGLLTCIFYTVLLVYWHSYFTRYYWSIDMPIFTQFYWSTDMPILHIFTGLLTCLFYTVLLVYWHAYCTQFFLLIVPKNQTFRKRCTHSLHRVDGEKSTQVIYICVCLCQIKNYDRTSLKFKARCLL